MEGLNKKIAIVDSASENLSIKKLLSKVRREEVFS